MYKGSLFERLHKENSVGTDVSTEAVLYRSVANNLSHIFSTNAGSAQTVQDYGRPDLNNIDMSMKDSIESIEANSERTVKKYEPRLYNTKVSISRTKLNVNQMNVHISGYLYINGNAQKVKYKADLLSNGKVKVYKDED
jgi:type VI secretion system protein